MGRRTVAKRTRPLQRTEYEHVAEERHLLVVAHTGRDDSLAAGIEVGEAQKAMGYVWAYLTAPDRNAYLVISQPADDGA